jgi:cbb3-type cytochrome oxidase subunit 3
MATTMSRLVNFAISILLIYFTNRSVLLLWWLNEAQKRDFKTG